MKKIISLVAALAVSMSAFVSLATVASAETAPRVVVSATEVDFTDAAYSSYAGDYDWSEYDDPGVCEYKTYDVEVKLTGLELETESYKSGKSTKYRGTSLIQALADFAVVTEGERDDDWKSGVISTLIPGATANVSASKLGVNGVSAGAIYPAPGTAVTVTASDEITIWHALVTVDKFIPVTLNLVGAGVTIATFSSDLSAAVADSTVEYASEKGNFDLADVSLTLPVATVPSKIDVTSVTISGDTSGTVGTPVNLTATVAPNDATNQEVTWTLVSGNGSVTDGAVSATEAGDVVVKATADGVDSENYTVTFTDPVINVESVTISGDTAGTVGTPVHLTATVAPNNATDKTVTWTLVSGNGSVTDGDVSATEAGDVVVKATAGGVDSANYTVTFAAPTVPATGITINDGAAKAIVGTDVTFTAAVAPPTTTDAVVWSISPTDGATVDNGVVTATKAGQYTVTATAGDVSDSKVIAFFDAPVAPVVNKTVNTATKAEESEQKIGDYYYSTSHATVETPDFVNFDYNVWARDIGGVEAIVGTVKAGDVEGSGTYNFILMIKSKAHKVVASWIAPALK